jgi:hypothetical protein
VSAFIVKTNSLLISRVVDIRRKRPTNENGRIELNENLIPRNAKA